jgi:hypothetical protein
MLKLSFFESDLTLLVSLLLVAITKGEKSKEKVILLTSFHKVYAVASS